MPRGGRREGAGRKTQWVSGCTFPETTVIRVPSVLRDKILDIAHRLDAGDDIDLVTNSTINKNQCLENRMLELEATLIESQKRVLELEAKQLKNKSFHQLKLFSNLSLTNKQLEEYKTEALNLLRVGKQSDYYKRGKKAIEYIIDKISKAN